MKNIIIRKDRHKGKTTELIKIANKENKYIICATMQRAELINKMAMDMKLDIPFPITVGEIVRNKGIRSPFVNSVLVDDMEDVLGLFIQKPIDVMTTSMKIVVD